MEYANKDGLLVPEHILSDKIEALRWHTRKQKALLDLSERRVDKRIVWDGLVEHYQQFFHEDIYDDLEFRRFFDELKQMCHSGQNLGKKFGEVSKDLQKAIKRSIPQ